MLAEAQNDMMAEVYSLANQGLLLLGRPLDVNVVNLADAAAIGAVRHSLDYLELLVHLGQKLILGATRATRRGTGG